MTCVRARITTATKKGLRYSNNALERNQLNDSIKETELVVLISTREKLEKSE